MKNYIFGHRKRGNSVFENAVLLQLEKGIDLNRKR